MSPQTWYSPCAIRKHVAHSQCRQHIRAFSFWLVPEQVAIIPIAERHYAYANEVSEKLKAAGFRIKMDDRNEKMGKRIRESEMQKIPVMLILGDKDIENQTVSVRRRTEGDLDAMSLNDALALFAQYRDA